MSIFRTRNTSHPVAESPSLLFRDLRRSPEVKFLWEHQGKLLDDYHKNHLNTPDVALELPTGSGKTLVGLLVAEYKRQADRARVVYLCPTRQLCNQVNNHASRYGISCSLLVGPQRDYDEQAFIKYQRGQSIGITTYSGIFNSNPRINDAQVIICDDAHAADNYISKLWSLHVKRGETADFSKP
jgi:replicative superfamily II helicase